jgi:hypothetical protein
MSLCQGNRGKGCCSLNSPFLRKTRVGSLRDRAISSFRGRINDENLLKSLCRLRLRKFVSVPTGSPRLCSEMPDCGGAGEHTAIRFCWPQINGNEFLRRKRLKKEHLEQFVSRTPGTPPLALGNSRIACRPRWAKSEQSWVTPLPAKNDEMDFLINHTVPDKPYLHSVRFQKTVSKP